MEGKIIFTYIILDQKTNTLPEYNVILSTSAWGDYLKKACKLRARIFLDEGMIPKEEISQDGVLVDHFDEISSHFLCFDKYSIVGAVRAKVLTKNFFDIESCIIDNFEEFGYKHHLKVLKEEYKRLMDQKMNIIEYSKLIVDEDYRLFKCPESTVAISLLSFTRFFYERNNGNVMFIGRGNKYQTKGIYQKMGYDFFIDPETGEIMQPFWKFGDMNDLMVNKGFSSLFIRVSEKFKNNFNNAITMLKK